MRLYILIPIAVLPVVTATAIGVYLFGSQINEGLKTPYAANLLLIILILVDGSGGALVPFLYIEPSNGIEESRDRKKRKRYQNLDMKEFTVHMMSKKK